MDRLEAMSVFLAVVDAGSFSGASRKLGKPLPTISRKIADLEAYLNTQLLVRSTRHLALTDAGATYLDSCKRILEQVGDAERAAAGEFLAPRGDLIIAAPIVFGRLHVLPVVNAFLAVYPDINVRLILSDRNAQLVDDHIDLAVRIGALADSSMIATRVGAVRRVVCGSPAYFAARGRPSMLAALSHLDCISFDSMGSTKSWAFPLPGRQSEQIIPIRSRLVVNTAEAAIDAAIAGVGVTRVLSYQVASHVAEGRLELVLADFEPPPVPVSLVHAAQGLLPLKMRTFVDFAVTRLRASVADPSR